MYVELTEKQVRDGVDLTELHTYLGKLPRKNKRPNKRDGDVPEVDYAG